MSSMKGLTNFLNNEIIEFQVNNNGWDYEKSLPV